MRSHLTVVIFQKVCCPVCHLWWTCRHFEAIFRERMWPQH